MHAAFSILALAATVTALPAKRAYVPEQFTISMRIGAGADAPVRQLIASQNGTYLKTQPYILYAAGYNSEATPTPTPFYTSGNVEDGTLIMNVNGAPFYPTVADIGDLRGAADTVMAGTSTEDDNWIVSNSTINHKLAAANNLFLACNRTVDGVANIPVLTWGSEEEDGSFPAGCYATTLFKECNVAGSTATCTAA